MKKIIFILLFLSLLAATGKAQKDTARVTVDSILYSKQEVKLDSTLTKKLIAKLSETEKRWRLEWIIPFAVSAIFGITAYIFSLITIRRDKRYRDLAFIAEVDKLLLEHPDLWAYEDAKRDHYLSEIVIGAPIKIEVKTEERIRFKGPFKCIVVAEDHGLIILTDITKKETVFTNESFKLEKNESKELGNDPDIIHAEIVIKNKATLNITQGQIFRQTLNNLQQDKIDAFCYYKLNNFELALKGRKKAQKSWINYLAYIFRKSTSFRRIIREVRFENRAIYNESFVKKLEKYLHETGCIDCPPNKNWLARTFG